MQTPPPDPRGHVDLAPGRLMPAGALRWSFVRSGGPGGQNVNKVATKAVLRVRFEDLRAVLPGWAVDRLIAQAGALAGKDELILSASHSRSQLVNRKACMQRLRGLVVEALNRPKPRRPTRPTRGAIRRRLEAKKHRGAIKRSRRPPGPEHA